MLARLVTLAVLSLTLLLSGPARATETKDALTAGYDLENPYLNPLATLAANCHAHADFYRVYRPVFPLVNHVIIGVEIRGACGAEPFETKAIYGASKGAGDMVAFVSELASPSDDLEALGSADDSDANAALEAARAVSLKWETQLQNKAYLYSRIVATPLLGRPCALAAQDVIDAIAPWVKR